MLVVGKRPGQAGEKPEPAIEAFSGAVLASYRAGQVTAGFQRGAYLHDDVVLGGWTWVDGFDVRTMLLRRPWSIGETPRC